MQAQHSLGAPVRDPRWRFLVAVGWMLGGSEIAIRAGSGEGTKFAAAPAAPAPSGYVIDVSNRNAVVAAHRGVYLASEGVPHGWTGNLATCTPGTTSSEFKAAVLRRINYMRALAGVPGWLTLSEDYNLAAQAGALILSGTPKIDHFPPPTVACYSALGAQGLGSGNIAFGTFGPEAIDVYMRDAGDNNTGVGHRRWLLHPNMRTTGTGDVPPGSAGVPANVIWVLDTSATTTRPRTREEFVAWPPPGYVPYRHVFERWSLSMPGADFGATTVTVRSNGIPIAADVITAPAGHGDMALVWRVPAVETPLPGSHRRPDADVLYDVQLGNVRVDNAPREIRYTVRVIDPDGPTVGALAPTVSGPTAVGRGETAVFPISGLPWAETYTLERRSLFPVEVRENAESNLDRWELATTAGYNVRSTNFASTGSYAIRLVHARASSESVTLRQSLQPGFQAALSFSSRLGRATTNQVARVQISTNDGISWSEVHTQAGVNNATEPAFTRRTIALGSFAGQTIRLRFVYTFVRGTFVSGTSPTSGWFIDDIEVTGCESYGPPEVLELGALPEATLLWSTPGTYALRARARGFGGEVLDWGGPHRVTVQEFGARFLGFRGLPAWSASALQLEFSATGWPDGTGFSLLRAASPAGPWAQDGAATLTVLQAGETYRFATVPDAASAFYRVQATGNSAQAQEP